MCNDHTMEYSDVKNLNGSRRDNWLFKRCAARELYEEAGVFVFNPKMLSTVIPQPAEVMDDAELFHSDIRMLESIDYSSLNFCNTFQTPDKV